MQILRRGPEGRTILNPADIPAFVDNARSKAAAIVVCGKDVIVSTEYTDHNTMMELAGIDVENFDLDSSDAVAATFRGGIVGGNARIDIWRGGHRRDDDTYDDALQARESALQEALDFLKCHPRLSRMSDIVLAIFDDDYVHTHDFGGSGLVAIFERADVSPAP